MIKRIKHIKELWQKVSKAISKEVKEEIEYVNDGNGKGLVDFWVNLYPAYTDYSLTNAEISQNKILKYLTGDGKLTQKHIDKCLEIIHDQYQNGVEYLNELNKEYSPAVYDYYKLKLPIKIKKATEYTDDITGIDIESIKQLSSADLVWIYNHSDNTQLARDISRDLEKYKLEGNSIHEAAEKLRATFAEYTPEQFAKHFGEKYYWKSFVRTQTQRIKSFSNINSMIEGGYDKYRWVTRGDPCPICEEFDGNIYSVSDAKEHMDSYFEASNDNDTEAMKDAMPWIPLDDIQDYPGMMPQIHGGCVCEVVTVL